jgi:predicted metal-binding membrane protein
VTATATATATASAIATERGTARRARGHVPLPIVAGIGVAWLYAVLAWASGYSELLDHDRLFGHAAHLGSDGLPPWAVAIALLASWQIMTAAMMLPSSVPMVRLFGAVSARQPRAGGAMAAFLCGYALVWTMFAVLALAGDAVLHRLVDSVPNVESRPWVVTAGVLALAGAFQFSSLKDRCLDACRHPAAFLLPRYRRGTGAAFALGRSHGLFCLGCCWALMLVMCVAGFADLRWMAALGALMAYEKIGPHGELAVRIAGIVLLAAAALVVVSAGGVSPL